MRLIEDVLVVTLPHGLDQIPSKAAILVPAVAVTLCFLRRRVAVEVLDHGETITRLMIPIVWKVGSIVDKKSLGLQIDITQLCSPHVDWQSL